MKREILLLYCTSKFRDDYSIKIASFLSKRIDCLSGFSLASKLYSPIRYEAILDSLRCHRSYYCLKYVGRRSASGNELNSFKYKYLHLDN